MDCTEEPQSQASGRKVAIVGTAPDSLHFAPWEDESWEVWSLAGNFNQIPRMDRWFEFHPWPENPMRPRPWEITGGWDSVNARRQYLEWLASREGGLVVAHPSPQMPGATAYPLEAILEAFPSRYFTNSVAWMLALAIWEEVDVLGLWGVDMSLDSEYGSQRPSCEYFIGLARGRGIPVVIPDESDLLKSRRLYGFEPPSEIEGRLRGRLETTRYRKKEYENQKVKAMMDEAAMGGHIEALEWVSKNLE